MRGVTTIETTNDAGLVQERLDQLLTDHDPKGDPVAFLGAQFDLGLAWVHFPEGRGGLGLSPRFQKLSRQTWKKRITKPATIASPMKGCRILVVL